MNPKALLLLSVAAAALAVGCKTKPVEPVSRENLEEITATVTAIDQKKRLVSLRGAEGLTATIEVPPDVRNLSQVKVGDNLVVRYYESLGAAIIPKGTIASTVADQATGAVLAPKGAKPGAAIGTISTLNVVIQSVDKKTNTVVFAGPDGLVRTVQVQDPNAQKFIAGLKKGDEVQLTYSEALAVTVEVAKSK